MAKTLRTTFAEDPRVAWRHPRGGKTLFVLLRCATLATAIAFWRYSALAGWLMFPNPSWVSFAVALSLAIWNLNR
ncbi:MAG: tryptophan-rich sensory protein [Phycisphaerae bacterium]